MMRVPDGSGGKEFACKSGDPGSIPGSGRSSGQRNVNLFQYSCLGNPMDRGVWLATIRGVTGVRLDLASKPLYTNVFKADYGKLHCVLNT